MPGALVQTAALALLHFLWEGLVIGVLAASVLRTAGRTAQQRHLICMAALVCCLLAPLITAAVVAPHVTDSPAFEPPVVRLSAAVLAGASPPALSPASGGVPGAFYATVLAWLAGALCVTAYYTTQWLGVWRVRRGAVPLQAPEQLAACARDVLSRFRQTAQVWVMASHAVLAPVVIGVWRPVIVFPAALMARMSVKDFELILLHEAAHIVRRDTWANALQISLEILLFYHPAVHWLSRRARLERECACDDFAVSASGTRYEYARALTALALGPLEPVAPVSLGAAGGQLLQRLHHLAGEHAAAESFHRSPAHLLLLAAVLSCVLLMRQPLTLTGLWSATHVQPTARDAARSRKPAPAEGAARARATPLTAPVAVPLAVPVAVPSAAPVQPLEARQSQPLTPRAQGLRAALTPSTQLPGAPLPALNSNSATDLPAQPDTQTQELPAGGAPAAPADASGARAPGGSAEVSLGPSAPALTPIYDPAPEYPLQARLEGVQGSVLVIVRVGSDGRPTGLKIVKASPLGVFEAAVHRALMRWRFRVAPGVQDGQAAELTAAYQMSFSLAGVSTQPASICATATASRTCGNP